MAQSGNVLFKYRGQIPVVLFLMAALFVFAGHYDFSALHPYAWLYVIISILGFIIRFIAIGTTPAGTSGRNTQEQVADFLNTKGIYSTVRHPLYLGNFLIWLGIVCYVQSAPFILIFALLYWVYYERIMFAEETFLEKTYGKSYEDWAMKTPAFIPNISLYEKSNIPFSLKAILRREYSGILATIVGYAFVDFCIYYFHERLGNDPTLNFYERLENYPTLHFYTISAGVALVILSKLLRKFTNLLNEEGRS